MNGFFVCRNLFDGQFFLSAHIHSQGGGNVHAAVFLQVVFQKRDQHARRSHDRVVERMGEIVALAAFEPDAQPSRLRVAEVGAAPHFEIFLLAGRPCLDVEALDFEVGEV